MASAGITVRVIPSKMGARALHEVFFEDVRVGPDAVLGAVDAGWDVVGRILHNERIGIPRYILSLHALDRALGLLGRHGRVSDVVQLQAKRARAAGEAARLQCYKVVDSRLKVVAPSAETH